MHLLSLPKNRRYLAEVSLPEPSFKEEQQQSSSERLGFSRCLLALDDRPHALPFWILNGGQSSMEGGREGEGRGAGRKGKRYSAAAGSWLTAG